MTSLASAVTERRTENNQRSGPITFDALKNVTQRSTSINGARLNQDQVVVRSFQNIGYTIDLEPRKIKDASKLGAKAFVCDSRHYD